MVVNEFISRIESGLNELESLLLDCSLHDGLLAVIPPVAAGCENDPVDEICIEQNSLLNDRKLIQNTFSDLYIQRPHSQKASRRYVGFIHLPATDDARQIAALVGEINQLKQTLQQHIVTNYKTRGDRFRAIHEACPGVMTMHLYRQIHLLVERELQSLRFTWQRKEVITCPDKDALVEQIAAQLALGDDKAAVPLELLLNAVIPTPPDQLRVRRPVKVQPAANAVCVHEKFTLNAPLPIIVIQNESFKTKPIANFSNSVQRKTRADRRSNLVLGTFNGFQIERTERDGH